MATKSFRAVKAQLNASIPRHVRVESAACPKCRLGYHLFAEGNVDPAEIEAQVGALRKYLAFVCQNHLPDVIRTPDTLNT
jgi:hypothetical protein